MKKTPLLLAGAMLSLSMTGAYAQSSVNIYGLISAGVGYATNTSGKSHSFNLMSGTNQSPRLGFRGSEDLGGGTKAIFTLEQGFNVMTGSVAQNGRMFGRQSWLGLTNPEWGTIRFGRQYDMIHDYLGMILIASNGVHIGDNDNAYNNIRLQNSAVYATPVWRGWQASMAYAASNGDSSKDNRAMSVGGRYTHGDVEFDAAYSQFDNPYTGASDSNLNGAVSNDYTSGLLQFTKSGVDGTSYAEQQKIAGIGGFYRYGAARFGWIYTNVHYYYKDNSKLKLDNLNLNVNYQLRSNWVLGLSYSYTQGHYDIINTKPKWHQVNLQADYLLSKRTDIILLISSQFAAGDAHQARIFGYAASSSARQTATTLGIRHRF